MSRTEMVPAKLLDCMDVVIFPQVAAPTEVVSATTTDGKTLVKWLGMRGNFLEGIYDEDEQFRRVKREVEL